MNGDCACRIRRRKIAGAADQLAGRDQPIVSESGLQPRGGRTFNANLDVAPMLFILRVAAPVICDACASSEGDTSIDDQRLSMIAMVESPDRRLQDGVAGESPCVSTCSQQSLTG